MGEKDNRQYESVVFLIPSFTSLLYHAITRKAIKKEKSGKVHKCEGRRWGKGEGGEER